MGYTHIGKRVALTTSGDMFLDPNAIETSLWSSAVLGFTDHRKQACMKSLSLIAAKFIPHYEPVFLVKEENHADATTVNIEAWTLDLGASPVEV